MTRRHLISFAYVSCPCGSFCPRLWSNLYFCHSQNSQKNLINSLRHIFVKYVKTFLAYFKNNWKIFIFLFCSEEQFVKEVPLWHVQIVSIFYSAFLCPNNHPPPNASSIHSLFWAQLQHSYLCPVWYFAKQVPPRLLLLSWKFVKTVFLVTDHPQPKLTPISHVHFPYR